MPLREQCGETCDLVRHPLELNNSGTPPKLSSGHESRWVSLSRSLSMEVRA